LSDLAIRRLASLVADECGFRVARDEQLQQALAAAAPGIEADAFLRLATDPRDGGEALARLIDVLTVKETFFFRDSAQLEAIDFGALLAAARADGRDSINAWVAGCASGEEVYTLTLLALQHFGAAAPIRVLGTDISRSALATAQLGHFRGRSVALLPADLRNRWFEQLPDQAIGALPPLRGLIRFARHNLLAEPCMPAGHDGFDLIVCRNVLIYFDRETAVRVVEHLTGALRPGGALVLGAADRLPSMAHALESRAPRRPRPKRTPRLGPPRLPRRTAIPAPDAERHFLDGLRLLETDPREAAAALRRALYLDPTFGLAAFQLGRTYEALGDAPAARRTYERAMRTLGGDGYPQLLEQIEEADIAAAARTRIAALA
jgi:chemotaxis methyl-accepting protein methylase